MKFSNPFFLLNKKIVNSLKKLNQKSFIKNIFFIKFILSIIGETLIFIDNYVKYRIGMAWADAGYGLTIFERYPTDRIRGEFPNSKNKFFPLEQFFPFPDGMVYLDVLPKNSVVRKKRRITLIINGLNSMKQRGKESKRLIELAFRETYLLKIFQNKDVLSNANVWLGNKSKIELMAEKPLKILVNRSSLRMIKTTITWMDPVKAPVRFGQKIGTININIPGSDPISLNLVSKDNVNGLGPIDKIKSAINYLIFGGDLN